MVGKNNGVAALLKRENPRLVNVHCICHRLALACGDSNNEVEYMLTIERLLVQLYKWLENSCVKTAAYLNIQLRLRDMQLPVDESKRHKIGHKLQKKTAEHGGCPQTKRCWGFGRTTLQFF